MAKDPATLWYWNDWQGGTITLSRYHKGCYMDLLHAQFNAGHLSIDAIKIVLNSDFDDAWGVLKSKFVQDENGLYFNEKAEEIQKKRSAFTASRRNNLMGKTDNTDKHMDSHMDAHMENENEDVNTNTNALNNKREKFDFDSLWKKYPNRQGKKNAERHFNSTVKTDQDYSDICKALDNYLQSGKVKDGYIQNGSTWFNDWQSWVEPTDTMMRKNNGNGTANRPTGIIAGATASTAGKYDKFMAGNNAGKNENSKPIQR